MSETANEPEKKVHQGTVKFFNPVKGFGFIIPDANEGFEVFVHHTAIVSEYQGFRSLAEFERVEFEMHLSEKGYQASNVTGPNGVPVIGIDPKTNGAFLGKGKLSSKTSNVQWVNQAYPPQVYNPYGQMIPIMTATSNTTAFSQHQSHASHSSYKSNDENGVLSPNYTATPILLPSSPNTSVIGQYYCYWPPYGMVPVPMPGYESMTHHPPTPPQGTGGDTIIMPAYFNNTPSKNGQNRQGYE